MGTEYYIAKPNSQQLFYLGRRISHLMGIPNIAYTQDAQYARWESYSDVMTDIQENSPYFLEGDLYLDQIRNFAAAIYNFCDDKVILVNDCYYKFGTYVNYEEIDVYHEVLTTPERWSDLVSLIPKTHWIIQNDILYDFKTVEKYLEQVKKEKQVMKKGMQVIFNEDYINEIVRHTEIAKNKYEVENLPEEKEQARQKWLEWEQKLDQAENFRATIAEIKHTDIPNLTVVKTIEGNEYSIKQLQII